MIYGQYTVVLKTLLDNEETKQAIEKALSTYPLYTPENEFTYSEIPNREVLNKKILNYYKYREIGFETVGRFIDELEIAMNEIMPFYNQLYKSVDVMNGVDNLFGNVDIVESFKQEVEGTSRSSGNSSSNASASSSNTGDVEINAKDVNSKTPQNELTVPADAIDQVPYADEVKWNKNKSHTTGETTDNSNTSAESTTEGTSTGITTHTLTKQGNQGVNTYAHDLNEFRELCMNIEQRIINDPRIAELFMLVY